VLNSLLWCLLISTISGLISGETSVIVRWSISVVIVIFLLPVLLSLVFLVNLLSNLQLFSVDGSTSGIVSTILSFLRLDEFLFGFHLGFEFVFLLNFVRISDEFELSYSLLYLTPVDEAFSKLIYFFDSFFEILWRYWST
jgi:hypothetical protein